MATVAPIRPVPGADGAGPIAEAGHRVVNTPVGPLLLAATDRGLVRVAFAAEDFDAVLGELRRRYGPRLVDASGALDRAATQLDEYFTRRRRHFEIPLDRSSSTGFVDQVRRALGQIDFGETRSYAEVAALVGRPGAARAVGSACATNPLPIVVPCHRVVRADGGLGGYLGGLEAKATLLALEAQASST